MTMPIALRTRVPSALLLLSLSAAAQQKPVPLSPFVKQDAPLLILEHVRLIDGTGAAPREDMRIDIAGGKITAIDGAKSRVAYPPNAKVMNLTGKAVIPGLVGMHEHLFLPIARRARGQPCGKDR
jgi:adenine deaminase